MNDHERAVKLALKSNDEMARLFDKMGNADAPRGRILSAYRQARRAMASATSLAAVQGILRDLRVALESVMRDLLADATMVGNQQALAELAILGLTVLTTAYNWQAALTAWLAQYDAQAAQVQALYISSGSLAPIIGDATRVGAMTPAPIVNGGTYWLAGAVGGAWLMAVGAGLRTTGAPELYKRQAVAAIDERTTDCCLQVHGQIVAMEQDFHLTGTPRFADYLRNPPFHWNCRTATCLVHVDNVNDPLTHQMHEAAQAELSARSTTGKRQEIYPAHARSRR